MRKLIFLTLFLIVTIMAKAQSGKGLSLSVGPDFNIPLNTTNYDYGDLRNYFDDGLSGVIKLEVPVSNSVHFVLSGGFAWYANARKYLIVPLNSTVYEPGGYNHLFPTKPYEYIPLKGGLRYYIARYFYIDGEAGAAVGANSNASTSFIYAGSAGFIILLTPKNGLDFSFGYGHGYHIANYPFSMGQLSMGGAYKFGW